VTALVRHPSGYLYVSTSRDGIYRSVDDGDHWQRISIGTTDSSFSTIVINQNGNIYAAGEQSDISYLYVSIDNGQIWQRKNIDQDKPYIENVKLCTLDADKTLLATALGGYIYWSSDDGDTWTTEKLDLTNYTWDMIWDMTYDPASQYVFLLTDSGLYRRRRTESTSAWEKLENGLPNTIEAGSIIFVEETLLLSWREGREQNKGAVYNFYYSKDHGDHWIVLDDRAPVFSGCVPTMAIHPGGYVFAGLAAAISELCESDLFYCRAPFMNDTQITPERHIGITNSLPLRFELSQNYPNPFNPSTLIRYALPREEQVRLEVYDMLGRLVKILVDERHQAGYHEAFFQSVGQPSGIYLYRLQAGAFIAKRKMILIQ